MPKLTKRFIDSIKRADRDRNHFDSELPGFGLRVKPSGTKSYFIQYRHRGRTRKLTLGRHGVLTPAQAREMARQRLAEVRRGEDPSAERRRALKEPTVEEFAERYLTEHAIPKKRPSSVRGDRQMLRDHILPRFGRRKISAITSADVASLHSAMGKTPYAANRTLMLLSKIFNLAEAWGVRELHSNPCRHVEKYAEKKRERFLSAEEVAWLGEVLSEAESEGREPPAAIAVIRLLILTGCRLSEIVTARWVQVDFQRGLLWLKESKTGPRAVALGAPALELLAGLPRVDGNPHVIPSDRRPGQHFVGVPHVWSRIREQAELKEVRLHDLRHSYASVGAGAGLSLPIIGRLLGHTQAATTQRYAHLAADPVRNAADRVSKEIAATLGRRDSAELRRLRR